MSRVAPVAVVFGTRPEIIKLAPVIAALGPDARPVFTGQHYDTDLTAAFLRTAGIVDAAPDLPGIGGIARADQVGAMLTGLTALFRADRPSAVVVQGDTNTANAAAQAAHYLDIPVVHVEAGLRSYDRGMPEEINRMVVSVVADVHCCATEDNAAILRRAGTPPQAIHVTGNPIVEATLSVLPDAATCRAVVADLHPQGGEFVLATVHRPENADDPARLAEILRQLGRLGSTVILPLHPRTRHTIERYALPVPGRVRLMPPVDHPTFLALAMRATLIVSDSGGVQEETTVLRKPLVVVRSSTERPESIRAGFAILATTPESIGGAARRLLRPGRLRRLAVTPCPFGDGRASRRIAALSRAAAGAMSGAGTVAA